MQSPCAPCLHCRVGLRCRASAGAALGVRAGPAENVLGVRRARPATPAQGSLLHLPVLIEAIRGALGGWAPRTVVCRDVCNCVAGEKKGSKQGGRGACLASPPLRGVCPWSSAVRLDGDMAGAVRRGFMYFLREISHSFYIQAASQSCLQWPGTGGPGGGRGARPEQRVPGAPHARRSLKSTPLRQRRNQVRRGERRVALAGTCISRKLARVS